MRRRAALAARALGAADRFAAHAVALVVLENRRYVDENPVVAVSIPQWFRNTMEHLVPHGRGQQRKGFEPTILLLRCLGCSTDASLGAAPLQIEAALAELLAPHHDGDTQHSGQGAAPDRLGRVLPKFASLSFA